jgi:thioredoxin 1
VKTNDLASKASMFLLASVLLCNIFCGAGSDPAVPSSQGTAAQGTILITDEIKLDFSKYKITFIELGSVNCIPCRQMQPIMKEIAAEYSGQVRVVFYDVWKNPAPGEHYKIQLIPTQVFIDERGNELLRHVGVFPKEDLIKFLKEHGVK